jgi:hypothetical protein
MQIEQSFLSKKNTQSSKLDYIIASHNSINFLAGLQFGSKKWISLLYKQMFTIIKLLMINFVVQYQHKDCKDNCASHAKCSEFTVKVMTVTSQNSGGCTP